jgi:hypothetical protein
MLQHHQRHMCTWQPQAGELALCVLLDQARMPVTSHTRHRLQGQRCRLTFVQHCPLLQAVHDPLGVDNVHGHPAQARQRHAGRQQQQAAGPSRPFLCSWHIQHACLPHLAHPACLPATPGTSSMPACHTWHSWHACLPHLAQLACLPATPGTAGMPACHTWHSRHAWRMARHPYRGFPLPQHHSTPPPAPCAALQQRCLTQCTPRLTT